MVKSPTDYKHLKLLLNDLHVKRIKAENFFTRDSMDSPSRVSWTICNEFEKKSFIF